MQPRIQKVETTPTVELDPLVLLYVDDTLQYRKQLKSIIDKYEFRPESDPLTPRGAVLITCSSQKELLEILAQNEKKGVIPCKTKPAHITLFDNDLGDSRLPYGKDVALALRKDGHTGTMVLFSADDVLKTDSFQKEYVGSGKLDGAVVKELKDDVVRRIFDQFLPRWTYSLKPAPAPKPKKITPVTPNNRLKRKPSKGPTPSENVNFTTIDPTDQKEQKTRIVRISIPRRNGMQVRLTTATPTSGDSDSSLFSPPPSSSSQSSSDLSTPMTGNTPSSIYPSQSPSEPSETQTTPTLHRRLSAPSSFPSSSSSLRAFSLLSLQRETSVPLLPSILEKEPTKNTP
jgi:hypothetical protein